MASDPRKGDKKDIKKDGTPVGEGTLTPQNDADKGKGK